MLFCVPNLLVKLEMHYKVCYFIVPSLICVMLWVHALISTYKILIISTLSLSYAFPITSTCHPPSKPPFYIHESFNDNADK